ncbi:MAG: hypothetical protein IJ033_01355 [Clostridia bacterium]|nr:hypothetical protein [Clostridia bacterium]
MVTLRRDVAASNSNRIFDRMDRETLTDYDIFMREKRMSEMSRSYGAATITSNSFDMDTINYFGAPQVTVVEPKQENYGSYDDYMKAQLHRENGCEKLLSSEEFYAQKYTENNATKYTSKKAKKSAKLTKAGKIFIGVYVLITVAVASTILALNLGGGESVKTKANADNNEGITALAMEFEKEDGNWFDSMCDSLSNK